MFFIFYIFTGDIAMWFKTSPITSDKEWLPSPDGLLLFDGVTLPTKLPAPYVMEPKVLPNWEEAKGNILAVLEGIDAVIMQLLTNTTNYILCKQQYIVLFFYVINTFVIICILIRSLQFFKLGTPLFVKLMQFKTLQKLIPGEIGQRIVEYKTFQ
jgi:hypothetical protein